MKQSNSALKVLGVLLKDFTSNQTATSLATELKMTRTGIWKILKKMEYEKLIILQSIGSGKTSTYLIVLNWGNALTIKHLELCLAEEAVKNKRWADSFKELENKADFLILFGSILHSPKEADDIDILIITSKNNLAEINEAINKIQKTEIKKIHALNLTEEEFKEELIKNNKAFVDAIKKGIVLFGQERFIKFIRGIAS